MKRLFLFKSKTQIGAIMVLTFSINVIMLCVNLSLTISHEQGSSQHASFSKYEKPKVANMEFKLAEKSLEGNQRMPQKNFKSDKWDMFSKQKGQMDFIPSIRMDDKRKSRSKRYVHLSNGQGNRAENKGKLEEIMALANENNGPVYHMYDAKVETEHIAKPVYRHQMPLNSDTIKYPVKVPTGNNVQNNLDVKQRQIYDESQGVPKTFDENYIKYFWKHPEFHQKNDHFKVEKTKNRKSDSDYDNIVEVEEKHKFKNMVKDIPKKSYNKDNVVTKYNANDHLNKGRAYMTAYPARGKLGNQMFQLASLLGIAKRGNFTPFLQMSHFELNEVFRFPKGFSKSLDISSFKKFSEDNYTQDNSLKVSQNLNIHINWSLDGWFQSYKYFNNVPAKVRHYLRFKKHLLHTALYFIQKTVPLGHVTVAVHVRRGDFISSYEKKLGCVEVPPEYFHRAMEYFRMNFTNITFIIVSDDIRWCRENIKGDNLVYSTYFQTEKGVDLALISHCDHVIVSVGTFGWWGGWLSRGTVVYYNKFPTPGSKLDKTFIQRNYYPSHWIPLE